MGESYLEQLCLVIFFQQESSMDFRKLGELGFLSLTFSLILKSSMNQYWNRLIIKLSFSLSTNDVIRKLERVAHNRPWIMETE